MTSAKLLKPSPCEPTPSQKQTFKHTNIGTIPYDWVPKTIGDVAQFSGGTQPPRSTFVSAYRPGYVRLVQIRDYKTDAYPTFIPASLARKFCRSEDIMIGRYGPPIFQILRGLEGAYNVALIKVIPSNAVDREFLFYVLKQDALFELIDSLSRRSSGQTGVEMPALRSYPLPLPPLPEQRLIADALNDAAALIASLDALISKKRDLKRAAMQQLLTGKTRLPGFKGDWMPRRLADLGTFFKGSGIRKDEAQSGSIPCIRYGEIYTTHNDHIRYFRSWISPEVAQTSFRLKRGDLLFAGSGETKEEIGKCVAFLDDREAYAGGDIVVLRLSCGSPEYLGYLLNAPEIARQKASRGQGDAVVHISSKVIAHPLW